ncbi:MAG: thermonuclease family protein [Nitrospinota bacterium]|nr:thermonuclease family protein [Nitrospinota bacterium]
MKHVALFTLMLIFLLAASSDRGKLNPLLKRSTFTANVVAVLGGDFISVELDKEPVGVRLVEVDSPEMSQTFGRQARKFTHGLAAGKEVTVIVKMVDKYKRVIGEVILPDGRSLNQEVVRWGYGWHYKVDPSPSKILAKLEYLAWKKKLGLLVSDNPVPPWKFRGGHSPPEPPASPNQVDYDEIFNYGLIGDPKTRLYRWPACENYKILPRKERLVFASKVQAEGLGYQADIQCPKH